MNLNSLQIVSLLANAFLCTFPEDKEQVGHKFPRFNFCFLFEALDKGYRHSNPVAQHTQKILCILLPRCCQKLYERRQYARGSSVIN